MSIFSQQPGAVKKLNIAQFLWGASYYGAFGLMMVFYKEYLQMDETTAVAILALFGALGPILSSFGGMLCDRFFGAARGAYVGFFLYGISYLLYAYSAVVADIQVSILGLSMLAFARGLSNTAIHALIASAYYTPDGNKDPRVEGSYTLNYMLNNGGSFLFRIVGAFLSRYFGYYVPFIVSAVLITIDGLLILKIRRELGDKLPEHDKKNLDIKGWGIIALLIVLSIFLLNISFKYTDFTSNLIYVVGLTLFLYFLFETMRAEKKERIRMLGAAILLIEILAFFVYYNQMYTSMNLYALNLMDPTIFGAPIPPIINQALNPMWIFLSSPILAKILQKQQQNNKEVSVPKKFAIGLAFSSVAFGLLAVSGYFVNPETGKFSIYWVLGAHLFQAIAELLVSAIGTAALANIIPSRFYGFVFGLRLTTMSVGSIISGAIAKKVALPKTGVPDPMIYSHFFTILSMVALGLVVVMWIIAKPLVNFVRKGDGKL